MIRFLLLVYVFLAMSANLGFAQSDVNLNRARGFAVLASTEVTNTGVSTVTGDLGISPGNNINDTGTLTVLGSKELATNIAAAALEDARALYDVLKGRTATRIDPALGGPNAMTPGVYKVNGNARLASTLFLNGQGDVNATFIFIVEGSLRTDANAGIILDNGAQAKNIFWVVKNGVTLGNATVFQGNILAEGDITLNEGTGVSGRAISLGGAVNFRSSTVLIPNLVQTDLSVTKVANLKPQDAPFYVGDEVTYTITVYNGGPSSTTGVTVTETLPEGLEFVSAQTSKGTYNEAENIWEVGELSTNETATLTLVCRITELGTITNRVAVRGFSSELAPANNVAEETIIVVLAPADLSVQKTALGGDFEIGGQVTYTVTASNIGDVDAINVVVQEKVPAGLELVSATPEKGTYNTTTNQWLVGDLAKGESATLTLVFNITAVGSIINGVEIVSDNPEKEPGDNTGEEPIDVTLPRANLSVSKQANTSEVALGDEVSYTITVSNAGPGDAENVVVQEKVPAGLEFVSASTEKGTYDQATNQWLVGNLANGASETLTIVFRTTAVGPLVNGVEVVSDNPDPTPGDNTGEEPIDVICDLLDAPAISGEVGACTGSSLTYTIDAVEGATGYVWTVPATWRIVDGQNSTSIIVEVGTEAGNMTVAVVNRCGTGPASTFAVTPQLTSPALGAISGRAEICENSQNLTYNISNATDGVEYNWTVPAGWEIVSGQGTGSITVNAGNTGGAVSVSAANSCGTTEGTPLAVNIAAPLVAPGPIADNSDVCEGLAYSIEAVPGATEYIWTVPAGFTITSGQGTTSIKVKSSKPDATGQVTVVTTSGTCSSPVASATIDASLADGQLVFPKAFSPNGDGRNDTWEIKNLEKFSDNEVTIFNRWGSELYKMKSYKNDWSGNRLEQGTYYYKVRVTLCDGVVKVYTGYTTIFR